MKRTIAGLAIFLILGLCTAITIAWAGAFTSTDGLIMARGLSVSDDIVADIGCGWIMTAVYTRRGDGRRINDDRWTPPEWSAVSGAMSTDDLPMTELVTGFPVRCARFTCQPTVDVIGTYWAMEFHGALTGQLPLPLSVYEPPHIQALPCRPIWSGLVINTLFYALCWALPLMIFAFHRRLSAWRKQRNERCAHCAYPLNGIHSPLCPECGAQRTWRPGRVNPSRVRFLGVAALLYVVLLIGFAAAFRASRPTHSLHHAAATGDIDRINNLLAAGVNVNTTHNGLSVEQSMFLNNTPRYSRLDAQPLHHAITNHQIEVVRILLNAGADPDAYSYGGSPLMYACQYDLPDMIRLLLDHGADPDPTPGGWNDTPLTAAARAGNIEAIRSFQEAGADLTKAEHPLAVACETGQLEIARYLIDQGAPVSAYVVEYACLNENTNIMDLVFDLADDLSAPGGYGGTLLHAMSGEPHMQPYWEHVLAAGADINARDYMGNTALLNAAYESAPEYLRFLLAHGADPTIPTNTGASALVYALDSECRAILNTAIKQWNVEHPRDDDAPPPAAPADPPADNSTNSPFGAGVSEGGGAP